LADRDRQQDGIGPAAARDEGASLGVACGFTPGEFAPTAQDPRHGRVIPPDSVGLARVMVVPACIAHKAMIEWLGHRPYPHFGVSRVQLGPDTSLSQPSTETATQTPDQGQVHAIEGGTTQHTGAQGWLDQFRAENSMLPNILLIGGMVIIVFLVMRALKRTSQKNRARTNAMGTPTERIAEIRENAMNSMEPGRKMMVDAEDMARRLGAALDNKAARLELLIEEADAKLDQLNRALANGNGREKSETQPETAPQTQNPSRMIDPTLLDRARVEQDLEDRQSRVVGRIAPETQSPAAKPPEPEISITDRIHELAMSGKSSKEIASELRQPIGQVELIMNLRKRSGMS